MFRSLRQLIIRLKTHLQADKQKGQPQLGGKHTNFIIYGLCFGSLLDPSSDPKTENKH